MVGVDVFVHQSNKNPEVLASRLQDATQNTGLVLKMITNRGVKVWPNGFDETFCTDHWRCRFEWILEKKPSYSEVLLLLQELFKHQLDVIKTENLYMFDGLPAYSMGQGQ